VNLTNAHIASKKQIGNLEGSPVVEIVTTGGLHLVVMKKGAGVETLGAGPHRAVARWMAKKRQPKLEISELTKSEDVAPEHFQHLVPAYEAFVERCNKA
jgi:hypothetical protein